MEQGFIDKIKELTGKDDEAVNSFLETLSLDDMYALIDAGRKDTLDQMADILEPLTSAPDPEPQPAPEQPAEQPTEEPAATQEPQADDNQGFEAPEQPTVDEAMKDKKTTIKVPVQKPRDPMARELTKGQYQPKVTPGKREILDRRDRKHRAKTEESVMEGVIGMTMMPNIKKTLELAGRPADDATIQRAMEDFMGDFGEFGGLSINDLAVPTGTAIKPGLISAFDAPPEEDEFDHAIDTLSQQATDLPSASQAYAAIRQSVEVLKASLPDIRVAEFQAVKQLISELTSAIDLLGNGVKGI